MKKTFPIWLALLALVLAGCHKDILNEINDLKNRVTTLEEQCVTMNTNIDALQVLINAQSSGDMISTVSEITYGESTVGYTITFTSGKTITLYNGKDGEDGKDGANGTNGTDGYTPSIGVAQDTDGIYYWTLDGTWLLDADGNKLPVTGAQGEKGEDGDKGDPGATGASGTNGITPQLKIEEDGYWYVSYDNGTNWEKLGKATGENGKDGANGTNGTNGEKGDKGDSMFSTVTQDDNYVYFTLADGTTVITVSKYVEKDYYTVTYDANGGTGTMEAEQYATMKAATVKACTFTHSTNYEFVCWNTQSDGSGVSFAAGDIILQPKDITLYAQWGKMLSGEFSVSNDKKVKFAPANLQYQASTKTWRFAENQYDYIGNANRNISATYTSLIDLFGWGTASNPTNTSTSVSDYTFTDWGTNAIGIYPANFWRTLTNAEWGYVFNTRTNASSLYGFATVNDTKGLILLPDSWTLPSGLTFNAGTAAFTNNVYTTTQWSQMESAGAVFLPAAGSRDGSSVSNVQSRGYYWSSTVSGTRNAYSLYFIDNGLYPLGNFVRYYGRSVRLVQDL